MDSLIQDSMLGDDMGSVVENNAKHIIEVVRNAPARLPIAAPVCK